MQVIDQFETSKEDVKVQLDNSTLHVHEELKLYSNELVEFRRYFEEV